MTFPDGTEAVADATFSVDRGEFVTVVGPSGCGKSTLLRIASGLLEPTGGSVTIDRQRIGYVFQDPTLMPWRTVHGNVELLPELHGFPREERRRRSPSGRSTSSGSPGSRSTTRSRCRAGCGCAARWPGR